MGTTVTMTASSGFTITTPTATLDGAATVTGVLQTSSTTDSTSSTTGALLTAGGLGVKKNVVVGGDIILSGTSQSTPASSTTTCETGTVQWDTEFMYICVGDTTYKWKRAALDTWS